jgi:hypothetical protein
LRVSRWRNASVSAAATARVRAISSTPEVSLSSRCTRRGFSSAEAQRLGQPVDMAGLLAAALRRQARRLVQRDDMIVAVDHRGADHLGIGLGRSGARLGGGGGGLGQRRHAHLLARPRAASRP